MAGRAVHPRLFTQDATGEPALVASRCDGCGLLHFPATPLCPWCGGESCTEIAAGRRGRLHLWTVVETAPPGYRGPVPYGFGTVEIDEGLRVVARLVETDPARLARGQRLELVLTPLGRDDDGTEVLGWAYATVPGESAPGGAA